MQTLGFQKPSVFIFHARGALGKRLNSIHRRSKKAERVGFEPTSRQAHYPFSRRVPSTAQAPLRLDGNASMTLEVNLVNEHFL